MPKKNNPGCNCCEGEDCTTRCLYKCTGTPCPTLCSFRIEMPTPDDVANSTGATCPDSDCDILAECNLCKILFDGLFEVQQAIVDRGEWVINVNQVRNACDDYQLIYTNQRPGTFGLLSNLGCWGVDNYNCPYETSYVYDQCIPEYNLNLYPEMRLTITYADGCSTTELEIEYTVQKACDSVGVPPNPPANPETTYTHLFRRDNQCDCDEVLGPLTYISTTSVNNSRGITVPDVCNFDAAVITLLGPPDCGSCHCFDCQAPRDKRTLTITGDWAGTYILESSSYFGTLFPGLEDEFSYQCYFLGTFVKDGTTYQWAVFVECLPCEKYNMRLYLTAAGSGVSNLFATADAVDCQSTVTLNPVYDPGATIEVS
jgi:hypothetical protein